MNLRRPVGSTSSTCNLVQTPAVRDLVDVQVGGVRAMMWTELAPNLDESGKVETRSGPTALVTTSSPRRNCTALASPPKLEAVMHGRALRKGQVVQLSRDSSRIPNSPRAVISSMPSCHRSLASASLAKRSSPCVGVRRNIGRSTSHSAPATNDQPRFGYPKRSFFLRRNCVVAQHATSAPRPHAFDGWQRRETRDYEGKFARSGVSSA